MRIAKKNPRETEEIAPDRAEILFFEGEFLSLQPLEVWARRKT